MIGFRFYVAFDVGHISEVEFDTIYALALEVSKVLGGLKAAIKKRKEGSR